MLLKGVEIGDDGEGGLFSFSNMLAIAYSDLLNQFLEVYVVLSHLDRRLDVVLGKHQLFYVAHVLWIQR